MKSWKPWRLTILLCALANEPLADTIRIRADEWLPYNGPATRKPPGYMIEMAEAIARQHGHAIDYATMPWDAAIAATREGRVDCVVGALRSDAEGFAFAAEPWGQNINGMFALEELNWRYRGIESLAEVRLAVISGYSYGDDIDAYIEANRTDPHRVVVVSSVGRALINAVSRLVTNRADVVIDDTNVATHTFAHL